VLLLLLLFLLLLLLFLLLLQGIARGLDPGCQRAEAGGWCRRRQGPRRRMTGIIIIYFF